MRGAKMPHLLWISLIALALIAILKLVIAFTIRPVMFIDVLLTVLLLAGLYFGDRAAYALTYVFTVVATVTGLYNSIELGLFVFIIHAFVLIPVLMSTDFFFPIELASREIQEKT